VEKKENQVYLQTDPIPFFVRPPWRSAQYIITIHKLKRRHRCWIPSSFQGRRGFRFHFIRIGLQGIINDVFRVGPTARSTDRSLVVTDEFRDRSIDLRPLMFQPVYRTDGSFGGNTFYLIIEILFRTVSKTIDKSIFWYDIHVFHGTIKRCFYA
jgi:hypothetical protein